MRPAIRPSEEAAIRKAFREAVNMSPSVLHAWLNTEESRKVGFMRRGETESVGRQSGRRILEILDKDADDLTESDFMHMRKVAGFARRHLAQRPAGDVTNTRWRWSLMNWGHDPLKR